MNTVILTGRIAKELELKYTSNGKAYCRFILAVDKGLSKEKNNKQKHKDKQQQILSTVQRGEKQQKH